MNGAKKDIKEITKLLASLQHYRSSVSDMKNTLVQRQASTVPGVGSAMNPPSTPEVSEGLLGRVPENTESIAELMLFDSDINVYGESNVYIPEFDFKNRVIKTMQKGKKAQKSNL